MSFKTARTTSMVIRALMTILSWKKKPLPYLDKKPAVFLFYSSKRESDLKKNLRNKS